MCQAGGTRRGTPPPPGPIPISAHAATVDVAHSRTPHTGGNRGIMRNSIVRSGHGRVPMCVDPPSLHMGARPPDTTPTRKARHSNKNQPPSCRGPTLPCATPKTPTPTRHTTPHTTNPPQTRTGTRPISMRSATDLAAEPDRSRHGVRPISVRNSTDLGTEYDRSRRLSAVTPVRGGRPRA